MRTHSFMELGYPAMSSMSSARLFSLLFSADSAKYRSVANVRHLAVSLTANQRV
jgi:hypothetical protein